MAEIPDIDSLDNQIETLADHISALRTNINDIADSTENIKTANVSDLERDISSVVTDLNALDDMIDDIDTMIGNLSSEVAAVLGTQRKLPTIDNASDEYLWEDCLELYKALKNKPRRGEILRSFIDRANIL